MADGVGGLLKHKADRLVNSGKNMPNAQNLFQAFVDVPSSVKLFYIEKDAININIKLEVMPKSLPAIPFTMKIHQVISVDNGLCSCLIMIYR